MRSGQAATQALLITGAVLLIALILLYGNRPAPAPAGIDDLLYVGSSMDERRIGTTIDLQVSFPENVDGIVFNEQSARIDHTDGTSRYVSLRYQAIGEVSTSGNVHLVRTERGVCFGALCAQPLLPLLECVEESERGYIAHFGYENKNGWDITIPAGARNEVRGGGLEGTSHGQPDTFLHEVPGHPHGRPGRTPFHPDAQFSLTFDGTPISWTITGPDGQARTATASAASAQC